jgi:hypothetical protein
MIAVQVCQVKTKAT